jgi:uncharacterized LabA/DUF88 family protein
MRTRVYIDGFNLFYGCLKGTPFKWLDVGRLSAHLLKPNDVVSIKYFAARVAATRRDPGQARRQDVYFRALRTVPDLEIILGHFLTHTVRRSRADGGGTVRVLQTEEKGSDVNLATHLIHDAHRGLMECAVLVTNDSDLAEPVRIARREIGIRVGVIPPTLGPGRHPSRELIEHATFVRRIRKGVLRESQFPDRVLTGHGEEIWKPRSW